MEIGSDSFAAILPYPTTGTGELGVLGQRLYGGN